MEYQWSTYIGCVEQHAMLSGMAISMIAPPTNADFPWLVAGKLQLLLIEHCGIVQIVFDE